MQGVTLCTTQLETSPETAPGQAGLGLEGLKRKFEEELAMQMATQLAASLAVILPPVAVAGDSPPLQVSDRLASPLSCTCEGVPLQVEVADVPELPGQAKGDLQALQNQGHTVQPSAAQVEARELGDKAAAPAHLNPGPTEVSRFAINPPGRELAGRVPTRQVVEPLLRSDVAKGERTIEGLARKKAEPSARRQAEESEKGRPASQQPTTGDELLEPTRRPEPKATATLREEPARGAPTQGALEKAEEVNWPTSRLSVTVDKGEPGQVVVRLSLRKDTLWGKVTVSDETLKVQLQRQVDVLRSRLSQWGLSLEQLRVDGSMDGGARRQWDQPDKPRWSKHHGRLLRSEGDSGDDDLLLDERA
ncbi:MAG: hypothetical protein ACPLPR_02850 [Bacillota bacterium]